MVWKQHSSFIYKKQGSCLWALILLLHFFFFLNFCSEALLERFLKTRSTRTFKRISILNILRPKSVWSTLPTSSRRRVAERGGGARWQIFIQSQWFYIPPWFYSSYFVHRIKVVISQTKFANWKIFFVLSYYLLLFFFIIKYKEEGEEEGTEKPNLRIQ